MKTKIGQILTVALMLFVAVFDASSGLLVSAAAWGCLGVAVALSGRKPAAGQEIPKTPQHYFGLLFLVLAFVLFGYNLYQKLS